MIARLSPKGTEFQISNRKLRQLRTGNVKKQCVSISLCSAVNNSILFCEINRGNKISFVQLYNGLVLQVFYDWVISVINIL